MRVRPSYVALSGSLYCAWPETALLAKCKDRACQGAVAEKNAILTDVEYAILFPGEFSADCTRVPEHIVICRTIHIEIVVTGDEVAKAPPVTAGAKMPFAGVSAGVTHRFEIVCNQLNILTKMHLITPRTTLVICHHTVLVWV